MSRTSLLFLVILSASLSSLAQSDEVYGYYESALTYGRQSINGSARMIGLGGAQNALGADMGTQAYNPAGIALFRQSNIAFSSTLNLGNSQTTFKDDQEFDFQDSKNNFNVNNFGIVLSSTKDNPVEGKFKAFNIGISRTRLDNYHYKYTYEGTATSSSYREYFTDLADGTDPAFFDAQYQGNDKVDDFLGWAYWSFLLNSENDDPTQYWTFDEGLDSYQREEITSTGAKYQWDISMGINYDDKIYFGAGVGLLSIKQRLNYLFTESPQGDNTDINYFQIDEDLTIEGKGANFKFGMVAKPTEHLRIGLSAISPTKINITEEHYSKGKALYNDAQFSPALNLVEYELSTRTNEFSYTMTTPWQINTGVAYFIEKSGFVSADFDVVSYGSTSLSDEGGFLAGDQSVIEDIYKTTVNVRIGGEYRLDNFRFRAGFAQEGNPYKSDVENSFRGKTNFTLGTGYRDRDNYVDLAVVHTSWGTGYSRYGYSDQSEPEINTAWNNLGFILSYGFTF